MAQDVGVSGPWWQLLTLLISAGVVTGLANTGLAWLKESFDRRRQARRSGRQIALELVGSLTAYSQSCFDKVQANDFDRSQGEIGRNTSVPDVTFFPARHELDELPGRIAARLTDLRNEVSRANTSINQTGEVLDPVDASETATARLLGVSYHALLLARKLRRRYGFGRRNGTFDLDDADLIKRYKQDHPHWLKRAWNSYRSHRLRSAVKKMKRGLLKRT
ncbi:hypothetical protein [Rhizobium laguerreae]|uniref:hypothetical protein n=1 Tax=Rhizobium laguerreae TaxID=1076926 RepID=UPI001C90CA31|nr:hypothetical protein [Rhizobium laguerreae]MBY3198804.1 hypothetical protein [Rhizobium laguerreae]